MNGQKKKISKKKRKNLSIGFTEWIGSESSLIAHTFIFIGSFGSIFLGFRMDQILLVLTTVLSLEAIYLAIFIQMTVNKNTKSLRIVEKDIDEIQEDIDEIQEDVEEIQEDVEEDETDTEKSKRFYTEIDGKLHKILLEIDELKKLNK